MGIVSRIATACFVIALPILLVTTNIRILLSEVRFYEHGFRQYDADATTGIDLAQLDRAGGEIVDYFFNDAEELRILITLNGEEVSLFNERETQHMADVKDLVQGTMRVHEMALIYVLGYLAFVVIWRRERSLPDLARRSLAGVGLAVVAAAGVGALAITGFDSAWNGFHEIAFTNDLWQLDPSTDRLIQMFPEPFWEEATFIVVLASIAEATLIVVAATAYLFMSRGAAANRRTIPVAPPMPVEPPAAGDPPAAESADSASDGAHSTPSRTPS